MNVLVTGAGGFVGKYLIQQLQTENKNVFAVKLPHETLSIKNVTVSDLNFLDGDSVKTYLEKYRPDEIYHLVAQSSVAVSWKEPQKTVDVNIKGTLYLLDAVRTIENYHPKILLIGSGEEYGFPLDGSKAIDESEPLKPVNIYAVTKVCQNMIGAVYAKAYGLNIIMVRAFNHIGAGQSSIFVASDFAKQIAEMEAGLQPPVMKVGNLSAKRDFSDVRDVVRAYTLLMAHGTAGMTYNVGSGHAVSIQELLDILISFSEISVTVKQDKQKMRPVDVPLIEADISRLRNDTGWKPLYSLKDTLYSVLEYQRQQIKKP